MSQAKKREQIISVGIDIGTSTTKLIVSRLSLVNTAGSTHAPRVEIVEKEVLYKSPIHRTPLVSANLIDVGEVSKLISTEYVRAGITAKVVQTGAVIITGETAIKKNAEELLHMLAATSGEFLVATAGPDLEGMIAAKGSGAYQLSKKTGKCIANIDIGGGTANIAVIRSGRLIGTCTLHIGGRLIEFEGDRTHVSPSIQAYLQAIGVRSSDIRAGSENVQTVVEEMASTLYRTLIGKMETRDERLLVSHPPSWDQQIDAIMFSGGVAECIYQFEQLTYHSYQDIGERLAQELRRNELLQEWEWLDPLETVRATVLGAGMQTTEISGSTIHVDQRCLPIRNLPVYKVEFQGSINKMGDVLHTAMRDAIDMFDTENEGINFAFYLHGLPVLRFAEVQMLADAFIHAYTLRKDRNEPMVVVVDNDLAQVLGQTIQAKHTSGKVVCLDQIVIEHGDYLDIGYMLQSEVVPVVIKTLAFQHTT